MYIQPPLIKIVQFPVCLNFYKITSIIPRDIDYTARYKTNANYENLVYDKENKRVEKNLLCDLCLPSSWVKKIFLKK